MEDRQLPNYYNVEDLDYIFIRAQDKTGNWTNLSLKEVSDPQFESWAMSRFHQDPNPQLPDDVLGHFGQVWNYHDRVWLLNRMAEILGRQVVVMAK